MRHTRNITLFVPENLSSSEGLWRRYTISGAVVRLRMDGACKKGEIYLFDRHCAAYSGSARCELPKIFSGCAVLTESGVAGASHVSSLPEGCLKVTRAEYFDSPLSAHLKICLG